MPGRPLRLRAWVPAVVLLTLVPALGHPSQAPAGDAAPEPQVLARGAVGGEVPDEAILAFHGPVPADTEAWLAARGGELLLRDDVLHWVSARFPDAARADAALAEARMRPDVRRAEHDAWVHPAAFVPDDPLLPEQWAPAAVRLPDAWARTLGSHAVRVAVLDTGVDADHPDLVPNLCGPAAGFVPAEPGIEDRTGHGTHVAGIAAAVTDNGLGVAGAAQSCLMVGKVLGAAGGTWSGVAAGIRWAADEGAEVISMSLVGFPVPTIVGDAIAHAHTTRGVLVVAAAGNGHCDPSLPASVFFPALFNEVVAVAALAPPGDRAAELSSCGPQVELAAPGEAVLSTYLERGYRVRSGTSMAAPLVAGVAALAKAHAPSLGGAALRCVLDLSADDLGALDGPGARAMDPNLSTEDARPLEVPPLPMHPGRDVFTGFGRVNATRSLELAAHVEAQGLSEALGAACLAGAPLLGGGGVPAVPTPVPVPLPV